MASQEWVYDPVNSVYYHAATQMFAVPNASGHWEYVPITDFRLGESSRGPLTRQSSVTPSTTKEEGELEDDVGWGGLMEPDELKKAQTSTYTDPAKFAYGTKEDDTVAEVPNHILRLVVMESSVLPKGGMAMIDAREGGIHLGRDKFPGQARLRVKEMEVSKTHAVIYWGRGSERVEEEREGEQADEEGWWIVDLGSTHGTFLDADRISLSKQSSLPHRLNHLNTIKIGHTTFISHIHPSWPCDLCQLKGDLEIRLADGPTVETNRPVVHESYAMDSKDRRDLREMKRKREMATLKENLLNPVETGKTEYQDRAAMRRRLHPPSPPKYLDVPQPVSPAATSSPAPVSRFAAGFLAGQGWKEGQGLGKMNDGRAAPIQVEQRKEKRGIGAVDSTTIPGEDWRIAGKQRRYNELR